MNSHVSGQQYHLQSLDRQNSWFNLTLYEVENQLVDLGKPPGSMSFDEYSQVSSVWNADLIQTSGGNIDGTSTATSFQHQASLTLARVISSDTVDKVWGETYNKGRR